MDRVWFQDWFSSIDELTTEQCRKVAAVLSDPPEASASLAAVRQTPDRLAGIIEADETFVRESRKGECGLSREQVLILAAAVRPRILTVAFGGSISSCSTSACLAEDRRPAPSLRFAN